MGPCRKLVWLRRCTYVQNFMTLGQTEPELCLFKSNFSTVCYSAPLWLIMIKFAPCPLGITLYQCAKKFHNF